MFWFIQKYIGGFYTVYRRWNNEMSVGSGYSQSIQTVEEARQVAKQMMESKSPITQNPWSVEIYYIPWWGKQELFEVVHKVEQEKSHTDKDLYKEEQQTA